MSLLDLLPYLSLVAVIAAALGYAWARRSDEAAGVTQGQQETLLKVLDDLQTQSERTERELRRELAEAARLSRQEQQESLGLFQRNLNEQFSLQQKALTETLQQRLEEIRRTVDEKLQTQLEAKLNQRDRKSTRLNSSHTDISRMPSSA